MPGERDRLVADPFHQAAVTDNDVGPVIDQIFAVARRHHAFGQRHADGGGDALSERAVRHSKTSYWKRGMAQRSPGATQKEWARAADVDGVGEIIVTDLLYQAPPQLDMTAMHGVVRSILLKLDSRRHSALVPENDPDNSAS